MVRRNRPVTKADVETWQRMSSAGISAAEIQRVTGWGYSTIRAYLDKGFEGARDFQREYHRDRRKKAKDDISNEQPEIEQTDNNVETPSDEVANAVRELKRIADALEQIARRM